MMANEAGNDPDEWAEAKRVELGYTDRVTRSNLDAISQAVGNGWKKARYIRLLDAAVWVASRDKEVVANVTAYRNHAERERLCTANEATEAVAIGFIEKDDLRRAMAEVTARVRSGSVKAFGAPAKGGGLSVIDPLQLQSPFRWEGSDSGTDWIDAPDGTVKFFDAILDTRDILTTWIEPKESHPSNLENADRPLVEEMHNLIDSGSESSPYPAALVVVDRAAGNGTTDSKVRRLVNRYLRVHGENSG